MFKRGDDYAFRFLLFSCDGRRNERQIEAASFVEHKSEGLIN